MLVVVALTASGCATLESILAQLFVAVQNDPCVEPHPDPPSEWPNYEETLVEVEQLVTQPNSFCSGFLGAAETGTCNGGEVLFVDYRGEYGGVTYYFDADTEALIAEVRRSDAVDISNRCIGTTYYIQRFECEDQIVTRSLCPE